MILTEKNFNPFDGVEINTLHLTGKVRTTPGHRLKRDGEKYSFKINCVLFSRSKVYYYDRKDIL